MLNRKIAELPISRRWILYENSNSKS